MGKRMRFGAFMGPFHARRDNPGLFSAGEYLPAETSGAHADRVFGFARRHDGKSTVVAVKRTARGPDEWQDTRLTLRGLTPGNYVSLLTGETVAFSGGRGVVTAGASELFATLPFAVLIHAE